MSYPSFALTDKVLAYVAPEPAIVAFEPAKDRAFFANPSKTSLLSAVSARHDLTPFIGTQLDGIQLNALTAEQRDELALLVAEVCKTPVCQRERHRYLCNNSEVLSYSETRI